MISANRTTSTDPAFQALVRILDKELWVRYPTEQANYEPHNKIENNNTVVIVHDDAKPIGCGCFKKFDDNTIEIKRMFVDPAYRGRGVSKMIMNELEQWAKELHFTRAVLETGFNQPEAIGLYQKCGYKQIPNYGPYVNMTTSLCMEKFI